MSLGVFPEDFMGEISLGSIVLLSTKENRRAATLLVSALLSLAGLLLGSWSWMSYAKGRSALTWPAIEGDLVTLNWHDGGGADFPTALYRYDFGGKRYEGNTTCFGAASEAADKLWQSKAGERIQVFVNPANPTESVLLPGPTGLAKMGFGIGSGIFLLGLVTAGTSILYRPPKQ